MRIVHFSTRLGRSAGGLYHSVSGLANAMAALGADVTVIGGREARFDEERNVWGRLPLVTFPLGPGRYGFSPAVAAEIARLQPDILHVHGIWSAGTVYARLAPRKTHVVVSPRGMLDPWIVGRRPWLKTPHAFFCERPSLRRAELHALSAHEAEMAARFMPELACRTFVLPNGIDPSETPAAMVRTGALYLGRLHEKKQVLELIDHWSCHTKKLPLTVAGWGSPDYERQVALACAKTKTVRFVGALYGKAKTDAFAAARFFILPSLSEGLPMAALEAAAHGAVPVLTPACHLPEFHQPGLGLQMADDFSDFAGLVRSLEKMPDEEAGARSRNVTAAARKFAWPDVARAMLDHYVRIRERPLP